MSLLQGHESKEVNETAIFGTAFLHSFHVTVRIGEARGPLCVMNPTLDEPPSPKLPHRVAPHGASRA